MTESPKGAPLDLAKELTCSICTEVLYQPLTLLDCLHTFCGSCLKFWFQWQASQNRDPRKSPYTCPSCRAAVRATSSDAKINTLLEMFLLANPGKGKTDDEKKDIAGKYTKGENVIPRPEVARNDLDEADRRMVEEARLESLRDVDNRSHRHGYERGVRHRHRSRDRAQATGSGASERSRASADSRSQARHIEHQSSLRSLISTDEVDAREMEEEILRQISEEGLLDGIELHDMTAAQLDELSERIADAYKRRHERSTHSPRNRNTAATTTHLSPADTSRATTSSSARRHARSTSAADEVRHPSNPPVSRPHLLEADGAHRAHRRRRSSESRRQTSPVPGTVPVHHQAARSATDLSSNQRHAATRERRPVELNLEDRRNSEPRTRTRRSSDGAERRRRDGPLIPSPRNVSGPFQRSQQESSLEVDNRRPSASAPEAVSTRPSDPGTAPRPDSSQQASLAPAAATNTRQSPSSSPNTQGRSLTYYPEPSVKCDRCGKADLQYDLHEHCSICNDGNYNLCHRCYREGKGCLNWYGFGNIAWHRYQRGSSHQDPPHALLGRRYLKPHPASIRPASHSAGPPSTTEDPSKRLLQGAFCSLCSSYADDCFWHCTYCNDAEWGYCNKCVSTGHCCTHPLLPLADVSTAKSQSAFTQFHPSASLAPITSQAMMHTYPPTNISSTSPSSSTGGGSSGRQ